MENPFETLMEKLNDLDQQLKTIQKAIFTDSPNTFNESSASIMNITQVANYLDVSKSWIYKMTSSSEIPHAKRGKKLYFIKADIDNWIEKHKVTTNDEIEKLAQDYILKNPWKKY